MAKTRTIIVIDDDSVSNFLCTRIVAKSGVDAEVKAFLNGREALDYLQNCIDAEIQCLPDIIFLDVNMPLMNGWEFLYEFKNMIPHMKTKVPVYMLSSSVYKQDIQKAREIEDVSDYIIKPITTELIHELWVKLFPAD